MTPDVRHWTELLPERYTMMSYNSYAHLSFTHALGIYDRSTTNYNLW